MAAPANISFSIGETWRIELTAHDSCGAVLNITGAEVEWRLALDGTVLDTLTVGNGVTIVDGPAGIAMITFTPADQAALELLPAFYQHECQVILPDGTRTDQFAGVLEAKPSLFPAS
jgi:hypothetical protein